ncbi:MAG TPA: 50S ribosomal protein L23 [Phycisphaerae bacterium]|nr:50S ribosomal protein L23 [Phycisphaerae bacterium]
MMELQTTQIIKRPLVSEKSVFLGTNRNAYSFEVDSRADKTQIKKAIEELYHVTVTDVRTIVVPGKPKRTRSGVKTTPKWKKAVVQVHADQKIDVY